LTIDDENRAWSVPFSPYLKGLEKAIGNGQLTIDNENHACSVALGKAIDNGQLTTKITPGQWLFRLK